MVDSTDTQQCSSSKTNTDSNSDDVGDTSTCPSPDVLPEFVSGGISIL